MSDLQFNDAHRIISQIRELLQRQQMVESVSSNQTADDKNNLVASITRKQHLGELYKLVNRLHPSDIATLLEQLPPAECLQIWHLIAASIIGAVLLELSDTLRDTLVKQLADDDLLHMAKHLDSDEIADLMLALPEARSSQLLSALPAGIRDHVKTTMQFPEDTVGAWMEFDYQIVNQDERLDAVIEQLREQGALVDDSGKLMVIDSTGALCGVLSVTDLLLKNGAAQVSEVMQKAAAVFHTSDSAEQAARDFERYELTVVPVVNLHNKLVGVLRVNSLMDLMEELNRRTFMAQAGLVREESLFDPFMQSARNRWPWIALNLMIVFIASRVISQFETTISSMVALAALLPITANIGGNTGNQVVALVIRGLALKQLDRQNLPHLFAKEMSVALINGAIWGTVTGIIILLIYQRLDLALVIMLAMLLTIVMAAFVGICMPLLLKKLNQDPALGSSVITTGFTDTFGFLIFLGLASLLLHLT